MINDFPNLNFSMSRAPMSCVSEKLLNPDVKTVVIIGNGFDLDLGMHTTYKDFADDKEYWPFDSPIYQTEGSIAKFLNDKKDIEKWFDLEEALTEYALSESYHNIEEDKNCFSILTENLGKYLQKEEDKLTFNHSVPAAKILLDRIVEREQYFIYSFNYTNLYSLARKMMVNLDPKRIQYVHGSLKENNIILGTGDVTDLPDEFSWLYKSFSPNYCSNNLAEDLADADEVFIFGHSLGKNDFDYFFDFFQAAIHARTKRFVPDGYSKIKIRIFTKDAQSEIGLKRQLRILTNKHVQGLYAHCDFKILHTGDDLSWCNEL